MLRAAEDARPNPFFTTENVRRLRDIVERSKGKHVFIASLRDTGFMSVVEGFSPKTVHLSLSQDKTVKSIKSHMLDDGDIPFFSGPSFVSCLGGPIDISLEMKSDLLLALDALEGAVASKEVVVDSQENNDDDDTNLLLQNTRCEIRADGAVLLSQYEKAAGNKSIIRRQ